MAVHRVNGNVVLGLSLPLTAFGPLFETFLGSDPTTLELERSGLALRDADFPEDRISQFVTAVCAWGHYPGIAGRILKHNTLNDIRTAMRRATDCLASQPPQLGPSLAAINAIHSLGTPSFASKHLRFIRPDLCPVYDAILKDALPYSFDPDGYESFATDCAAIARLLESARASNPAQRAGGSWYAADVEAALFIHVNSLAA